MIHKANTKNWQLCNITQNHTHRNDFSAEEQNVVENNEDNQIQTITLCIMYFLKKKLYIVCNGVGFRAGKNLGLFRKSF